MANVVDIGWKPAPSSPWVEYNLFLREKGASTWTWQLAVKHPRVWGTLPAGSCVLGHTYELMILCKTRLNIWNSETNPPPGARILEFTVTDSSPTPNPPGGLLLINYSTNGTIYVRLNPPGANTYTWEIWRSFVNDRDTAVLMATPYASQGYADQFVIGDYYSPWSGDDGKIVYYWVYPISYWGKKGSSYPADRFGGMSCVVIATPQQPESHSR